MSYRLILSVSPSALG
uniref:Uncharacterized protein n=1 Tax=Anguilla anguilla TaxID=7936 RepID=A0A0E9QA07_ANGAN